MELNFYFWFYSVRIFTSNFVINFLESTPKLKKCAFLAKMAFIITTIEEEKKTHHNIHAQFYENK